MAIKYVKAFTAKLTDAQGHRKATLLWGDPVHVPDNATGLVQVRARGRKGWLDASELTDKSLLEIYVIDVGQGDAVLVKTPDGYWHLIDAGVANNYQMTKKGAANFLRWKFYQDLRQSKVSLKSLVMTHPDFDHYGGMTDVLSGVLCDGRTFDIEVDNFYHPGLARFRDKPKLGARVKGKVDQFPMGFCGIQRKGSFITELLDDKDSFAHPPRPLNKTFSSLADLVAQVPQVVKRVSYKDRFLPGYAPGESDVVCHVLGPILEQSEAGQTGLRWLTNKSKTRNGHSVVLRFDYHNARILLNGDLNAKSQRLMLSYLAEDEFKSDVSKACHHGSEDVEMDFIRAMSARATVISSGDNEDYAHPRPMILGASAKYGREVQDSDGHILPPLIYSTELARSVKLAHAVSVRKKKSASNSASPAIKAKNAEAKVKGGKYRSLKHMPLSTDLIYGLVNIRTDGKHILCATMEEKGNDFDVKVFKAGEAGDG